MSMSDQVSSRDPNGALTRCKFALASSWNIALLFLRSAPEISAACGLTLPQARVAGVISQLDSLNNQQLLQDMKTLPGLEALEGVESSSLTVEERKSRRCTGIAHIVQRPH